METAIGCGNCSSCRKEKLINYLKNVLSFYQIYSDNQQWLNEECSKVCIGYVGVHYGRPAILLDEANYAKEHWDNVTDSYWSKNPS